MNIINTPIKTTCQDCLEGTFLNDDGECEILTPEKCNGYFIYKYSKRYVYTCRDLCYKNEYPMIYFELGENSINVDNIDVKNLENKINIFFSLEYSFFSYDKETNNILLNSPMCYVLLDEEKTKFKKCIGVIQLKSGSYQCLQCKSGYNLDYDNNKCVSDLKFNHCEEDEKDNLTGNYKCKKCRKNLYLNENGSCQKCLVTKAIINNKGKNECIMCDDAENGGIENCKLCKGNKAGDKIECKECKKGYILLRDNDKYECLNREIFDETNQFGSCLELEKKNDNYICVRCKIQYSLLNAKCVYTPTLFDINFSIHYNYPYDQNFEDYIKSEITDKNYYFNRQKDYFPCKE